MMHTLWVRKSFHPQENSQHSSSPWILNPINAELTAYLNLTLPKVLHVYIYKSQILFIWNEKSRQGQGQWQKWQIWCHLPITESQPIRLHTHTPLICMSAYEFGIDFGKSMFNFFCLGFSPKGTSEKFDRSFFLPYSIVVSMSGNSWPANKWGSLTSLCT